MKQRIVLTESKLRDIIKESVRQILWEGKYDNNKPLGNYIERNFDMDELISNLDVHNLNSDPSKDALAKLRTIDNMYNKHNARQKNKTFIDPLLQKHNERRRELVGRAARDNKLNPFGEINKWNTIPSSYESDYFEDDAVDIIVNYDLLPKSIKPKNFVAGKDMSPEGEIVYGHLSPSEESTIYRRLKKAGVPEKAITIYNC